MKFPFGNKIKFVTVRQNEFNKKGAYSYIGLPTDMDYELLDEQDPAGHLVYLRGFKKGSKGLLFAIHRDDLKKSL